MAKKPDSHHPLVLIRWLDSRGGCLEWHRADGLAPLEPSTCQTVGFLLYDGADYKSLTMCLTESLTDREIFGRFTIPTVAVLSVHELKAGKSR